MPPRAPSPCRRPARPARQQGTRPSRAGPPCGGGRRRRASGARGRQRPGHGGRAPRGPAAERRHAELVALLQAPRTHALVETDRDRGRRRVAVAVDVHVDLLRRPREPLAYGLDDAKVRLVRDEEVDLVGGPARGLHAAERGLAHAAHREGVELLSLHADEMLARRHGVLARRVARDPGGHLEHLAQLAVAVHVHRVEPGPGLAGLQHRRAGPIAEQHARVAVGVVHDARQRLDAHDQYRVGEARADEPARAPGARHAPGPTGAQTPPTSTVWAAGEPMSPRASPVPNTNPVQAANMSYAAARVAPSFCCSVHAHEGRMRSGVVVARMMWSTSRASTPAISSARWQAINARSLEACPVDAIRRSRMPVRSTIHSSEVSTSFARSAFVSTRSGTYMPVPVIVAPRIPSGRRIMIGLDLLANVFVDAALHERGQGVD